MHKKVRFAGLCIVGVLIVVAFAHITGYDARYAGDVSRLDSEGNPFPAGFESVGEPIQDWTPWIVLLAAFVCVVGAVIRRAKRVFKDR